MSWDTGFLRPHPTYPCCAIGHVSDWAVPVSSPQQVQSELMGIAADLALDSAEAVMQGCVTIPSTVCRSSEPIRMTLMRADIERDV